MIRLVLFFMSLVALAQTPRTTLRPDQLRVFPPKEQRPILLAFEEGGFFPLTLGPGIVVTKTASGWVIDVAPVIPTLIRKETVVAPATDGTYPIGTKGVLYRNGLRMAEGVDYTRAGDRAVPSTPWSSSDIIVLDEILIQ